MLGKHIEIGSLDFEGRVVAQKCADIREQWLLRQPAAVCQVCGQRSGRKLPFHSRGQHAGIGDGGECCSFRHAMGVGQVDPLVGPQCR